MIKIKNKKINNLKIFVDLFNFNKNKKEIRRCCDDIEKRKISLKIWDFRKYSC